MWETALKICVSERTFKSESICERVLESKIVCMWVRRRKQNGLGHKKMNILRVSACMHRNGFPTVHLLQFVGANFHANTVIILLLLCLCLYVMLIQSCLIARRCLWTGQINVLWVREEIVLLLPNDWCTKHQICLIKELAELQELQWVGSWAGQSINLWVIQETKLKPGWQIKLWVGHRRIYFIAMIMIDMHSCVWHVFIARSLSMRLCL
jgi:hypothetical protein